MITPTRFTDGGLSLHLSGLQEPAAVFVLPTPVVDNSGIAHLIEHLVFRYSSLYPEQHTLFAASSLLPITVNASSQNGYSYFFVTAQDAALLPSLVRYLYAGLLQQEYDPISVACERDGVIKQELRMHEAEPHYRQKMAIWRGDKPPLSFGHWGGYCDTISHIRLNDITAYKQTYFRPEFMHLVISGLDDRQAKNLMSSLSQLECLPPPMITPYNGYNSPLNNASGHLQICSWWVNAAHKPHLNDVKVWLTEQVSRYDSLVADVVLEDDITAHGYTALRLIYPQESLPEELIEQTSDIIDRWQCHAPIHSAQPDYTDEKYPAVINQLISLFHDNDGDVVEPAISAKEYASSQEVVPVFSAPRALTDENSEPLPTWQASSSHCSLLASLDDSYLSVQHAPSMPTKLRPLLSMLTSTRCFAVNGNDWLYRLPAALGDSEKLLSLITDEATWLPRLSGQCYAQGLCQFDNKLYFYGAMDTHSAQREQQFNALVQALLTT